MNRFAIYAVLALAAFALAQSSPVDEDAFADERDTQAALTVSDEEEVAEVRAKGMEVFADFCTQTRDSVYADVKSMAGDASARGFSWFFSMTEDITKEALEANKDATARLSNQLANPSAPVEGDDQIAQVQREMAQMNTPRGLLVAIQAALGRTAEAVAHVAGQKYAALSSLADFKNVFELGEKGCEQAHKFEEQMQEKFSQYVASMPEAAKAQFGTVQFQHVPCVTSRRISRVNGICQFMKVAFDPLKKAIGY